MQESESKPVFSALEIGETDRIASLEKQVTTLLLALVIFSGIFTVYMWRQYDIASNDLKAFKPGAVQLIEAMKREQPGMDKFVSSIIEYGKTHPDFKPIVDKYGLNPPAAVAPPAASAPAVTPQAPAAALPKK